MTNRIRFSTVHHVSLIAEAIAREFNLQPEAMT